MTGYGVHELSSFDYGQAGLFSGFATRCLIQPLDVQLDPTFGNTRGKYHGVLQALSRIYKEEGLTAFWKGHVPAQGVSLTYGLIQFTLFEFLTEQTLHIPCTAKKNRKLTDIICGALAGSMAGTAALPMDVIRTRLVIQSQPKVYNGMFHAINMIWHLEGFRGFFRGLAASLAQIAPYSGLQFCLYNSLSNTWKKLPDYLGMSCIFLVIDLFLKHYILKISIADSSGPLCCGALAGIISKTAVYPLDVVRHRLQVQGFDRFTEVPWTSTYSVLSSIVKNEKITGLFKGIWPSQLKAACSSGFSFMFYEIFLHIIRSLKDC
ncbi:unnamed protein product [Thelazia callipaeda]|uniref:Mitochondrial thiamine pyrophosphate carrier n=1 Tax=Thelazia callipaeda TaxID=103827 RepID=A0A0N5CXI3_THECL|nr:unnamed protein product [Thelazia callipaeda]